jgi:hypothetical protein
MTLVFAAYHVSQKCLSQIMASLVAKKETNTYEVMDVLKKIQSR